MNVLRLLPSLDSSVGRSSLRGATIAVLVLAALAVMSAAPTAADSLVAMSMTDPSYVGTGAGGEVNWWDFKQASSADGRYVIFRSRHPDLLPGYTGAGWQIYRYDTVTDTMDLVSRASSSATEGGSCDSIQAAISADGARVAFVSCASNLVSGYSGSGYYQIYVWEAGSVTLVSHDAASSTTGGSCEGWYPSISADGTRVAFMSCATNLVSGYSGGGYYHVYVWEAGAVTLVSHDATSSTTGGSCYSYYPSLSADGTRVAFMSCATNLVAGYSGGSYYQIYLWEAGTVTLVSHAASSSTTGGSCDSNYYPSLSADGTRVAFRSCASNLVAGYSGGNHQVYVWEAGTVTLISHDATSSTTGANCHSGDRISLSADGTRVAFMSCASNLVAGYSGGNYQIYVWEAGTVTLVSHDATSSTTGGSCHNDYPSISADGTRVAFMSCAGNLVSGYSGGGQYQIFAWEAGVSTLLSHDLATSTAGGNGYSEPAGISADGSTVVFRSQASNLVSGDAGSGNDVFTADVSTAAVEWVSRRDAGIPWQPATASGSSWPSIRPKRAVSGDGRYSAYTSNAGDLVPGYSGSAQQVYLYDRLSGTNVLVSHADGAATTGGTCSSDYATVSGDGSTVVFWSCATNLVSGYIGSGYYQAYLWDRATGAITLVSRADGAPTAGGNCQSYYPQVSADGQTVAFWSCATDLVSAYTSSGGSHQIYLWDRPSGAVSVVSHVPGAPATGGSCDSGNDMYYSASGFDLAADGQAIAFQSCATNLVPGYAPGGAGWDIYQWHRGTDTTSLVSEDAATAAQGADCQATSPTISADGSRVAFQSCATNLVPGYAAGGNWQVFAWEATTGESTLVSHADGSATTAANCTSDPGAWDSRAEISGDGNWVAYLHCGTDLVPGYSASGGYYQLYLGATSGASNQLISHVAGAPTSGSACDSYQPSVSYDASTVAFINCASDLVPGLLGPGSYQVYAWDRASDSSVLGSGRLGSATQGGAYTSYWPVLSSDGTAVAFRADSYDLVARDFNDSEDAFLWTLSFTPDVTPPTDPASLAAQAPHVENVWSNLATVTMEWSGAADEVGGSGLDGYSVEWNTAPVATPDAIVDVAHASDPHTYAAPLGDGVDHYFHLSTCDNAGNCTTTLHAGPFWIDATLPSAPGVIASPSHGTLGVPTNDADLELSWGAAVDATSGIDGYSYFLDGSPNAACDTVKDVEEGTLSASFPGLADGSWYVHVCAVDNAGNWGPVTDAGPFVVDATAPAADGLLYFSNFLTGDLRRMSVNGTGEVVLVSGENVPLAVEVDGVHGKIYWGTATEIRRSNLDGTGVESVAAVATSGYAIALDPVAGKLYWIDNSGAGAVRVAALDGSGAADLVSGVTAGIGLAIDRSAGKLYWTENHGSPTSRLMRCDLDGTDPEVVFATATGIDGIATDPSAARLLYSSLAGGEIRAVGDDGTGDTAIVATGAYPRELSFDRVSEHIYWAEEGGQAIRRARADGSDAVTLGVGTFGLALLTTGDFTPPTDPTVDSTSPSIAAWSNDNTVEVVWSGAGDEVGGSGLAGYSISWDHSPLSTPDAVVDIAHGTDPHAATSAPLADAGDWYFHLRTCDNEGNCTSTVHAGPFWIDTAAPSAPGAVGSSSHAVGIPSSDDAISVTWTGATDATSGIDGYSIEFDSNVSSACDMTADVDEATLSATSPTLGAGTWYVHVCAVDNAGNWGAVASAGPFLITDTTLPGVCALPFEKKWGSFGAGAGQFSRPFGVGAGAQGEVVVADLDNSRIQLFDAQGNYLGQWATAGQPVSVDLDSHGHVVVANLGAANVQVFTLGGSLVDQWSTGHPYGLTVDATDHIYVVNDLANVVTKYDHDGNFVLQFGSSGSGPGQFVRAWGVAVAPNGDLLVSDANGHRVQRFTSSGVFVSQWGGPGSGAGQLSSPTGIAATADGIVYVSEIGNQRIQAFTLEGFPLCSWGSFGSGDGQFHDPLNLTAISGHLYVADQLNHRIQKFGVDGVAPLDPTTVSSSSHAVGGWSSSEQIAMDWSGATDDVHGSGVAGYSVLFDQSAGTLPDATVDVAHAVDPQSMMSAALGDGTWYFHLSTCDNAGNCTSTVHAGPYWIDTSVPGPPGTISSSSHDPVSTPVSDATIDVAWGAASDGLSGVASYSYAFDGNPTGGCAGGSTAGLAATSAALADGSYYVHVCAVDFAGNVGAAVDGGPYVVDTTGPTGLVVSSTSHSVSTWSNDSGVDFEFSGATDANGVAGYAVVYDQASGTEPTCATTQAASTFTGSSSADGNDWWIHVRPIDTGNNCGGTTTFGPFWIDTTAPGAPGAVSSSSHDGGPTNDTTIDVAWGAATDALSGIDGYSYFFNGVDQDCDFTMDSNEDERSATSPPLASGTSYFHVCAVDLAGNWGAVTTGGPYVIDLSAPRVTTIDSVASSGGAIGEGEVVNVAVTQLLVSFDEAMDATLAETTSSYLLVTSGIDGAIDTAVCGPLQGDDETVIVDAASYAGQTSTLTVNGSTALAEGSYRLLVCASLEDVAGNPLDGDGNGSGGDDFVRSFRVDLARPTVTLVHSVADTGDGSLGENEPTNAAITELLVSFSEEVLGGDSSASFLLVEGGVDGTLDTAVCGPLAGDDASVDIDSAVYASLSLTSTLALNGGVELADGVYRLLVCGTLTDLGGNALDDDDDGDGNDDFVRNFVVDTVRPTNPTSISSSTHPYADWSQATSFTVQWSGATDELSGLAGYSVVIDGNPSGSADNSIEVGDVAGTGTLSTTLGEGAWYVHVRACDNAGNCASGVAEDGFWGIDSSAPGAPGAISSPSHDPTGTPVSDDTIDVAWGAASDTFSGVASYTYAFDGNPTGGCAGSSTASLSATSGALTDGSWYIHVCAVDYAGNTGAAVHGGPYVVDTAGPTGLVVSSPSHTPSTWSNDNSVDFVFSDATDANGVAGYAVAYDAASATEPTCATTQAASTFTGSSSPDGDHWWIHVRAVDTAGNCGDAIHFGPFWIDTAAPGAPGAVSSSSHDGGPTNDTTIDVAWGAATDALSGIDGYSFFFNGVDDDCDGTMDSDDDERTATSPPLAGGAWYFHVCAVDLAGNWGAVTTGGPYFIDLSPPHVTTIDSVATSGGAIGELEVVNVAITQLLVTFDEAMDVTLAETTSSYSLVRPGIDGAMDTSACGPLQGDDQAVSLDSASYAGLTTLTVNGSVALEDGTYRLLVCAALEDVAGNPLDGDGNGTGGDDFSRTFRVDRTPPTVSLVDSTADTGDGVLAESEPTNVAITELQVTFDEEVVGGDSLSNFLLVEGGLDGTLDTSACGPLAGDDTSLPIDAVVYASLTSTLSLDGGVALTDGEYRLLVCATLTDLGGNALDGDDDGDGPDDFARTFTVDTVPPSNPTTIGSSTHVLGAWSSVTGFAAQWSGGTDDRSGLAGSSFVIDGNPATAVDCTVEVADVAGTGATSSTLGEGAWYVHVRLRDRAGNCAVGEAEAGFWGIDTSAPGAPGAVASPSHDPVSTAVSDATIDVAWGAASDAVSSVASYTYAFDGNPTGSCLGSSTASLAATSSTLADGSWYLHVCAVDLAGNTGAATHGGPWIVDTTPPAGLALSSTSHTISTWSNDDSVDFSFSGATDANGIAGYAVVYDQASATEPACTTSQTGTTFTGSSSPDGNHWWIHVRARDVAGNCGPTVHLGPFWIDTVAPGTVSGLVSTDHAVGLPSIDATIAMSWSAATDDRSGVAGYSVQFSSSASTTCDGSQETSGTSFASTALAHGDWHVQVCARDEAGNWGAVTQAGPYTIDLVAPQVVLVDSVAATSDGSLTEGETTGLAITQLRVTFGEGMSTSGSLPTSYRLIAAGGDGFQTVSCAGGVSPQDLSVAIDAVSSLGGASYALALNGGASLPTGDYRLLACASLTDIAGNHLDGNGDTVANDDFVRNFTIDRSPPRVTLVETSAPTSGVGLDEDEATNAAVTTFAVTFSEPVYDPIGHTNPDDVTNPANYRLVETGGDGFQTVSCQIGVAAADVAFVVDTVTYDSPTRTATLAVNGGAALDEGIYRLYVCGSSAIIDLVGLPLDGDGDGTGGDDFVRSFQVDTTPPTNPVLTPNLPPGVWTTANALVVAWSGATDDPSGAGLAGYSVLFDVVSGTDPGTSIDVDEAAAHQAAATLADGATHFFHLVTCDRAGNCATPIEAGPFQVDTQAPSTPTPVTSSSHGDGLPHSSSSIAASWASATDQPGLSGVAGYLVSLQSAAAPPVCGGTNTGGTSTTLSAPADGTFFVHVCAVDLAGNAGGVAVGGPYVVDTAGPTGLVVSSSSHSVATWSSDNTVDFGFSGATDTSGIAGYAVTYDQTSATTPTCAATQAASTFTGSSSPDADDWWIHVRAIDGAGNCGATVHLGPFQVDTQSPAAPGGLASPSHDVGVASNDDTVEVEWDAALDQAGLSGIDGYGFFFSTDADDDCDDVMDAEEDVLSTTSAALADGEHYFHVCAVDNAGNWGPAAAIGPFVIDTAGAGVVAIGTVADTGDGELGEGEATAVGVTQLTVEFDGPMFDASGDSDPADVTNPANYRLYQAGPNGAVQTVTCGAAAGDDVEVAFAAASYSAATTTSALTLSGSLALPRESYRLLVCPTLEDDAGTPLAGFTRNFSIAATDLLANPNFDHDLGGWVVTDPSPGSLAWSADDLDAAPTSGSAELLTASGAGQVWALSQCFTVAQGPFASHGATVVESTVAGAPVVTLRLDFFDGAGCSGTLVDSTLSPPVAGDTGGFRTYLQLARNASPESAVSVLATAQIEGGAAPSFTVRLDDLFHGRPPALFADGFESSGTSAWSVTVP